MTGAVPAEQWFGELRGRFESLARRRVAPDAVDDVVQDAMSIVIERGFTADRREQLDGLPPLAWCFQVLRNIIGNHYQKNRKLSRETNIDDYPVLNDGMTPLEALEEADFAESISGAIAHLADHHPNCGRYLRKLTAGALPAEIAREEKLAAPVLYRRLYRCRAKLKEILEERGIRV